MTILTIVDLAERWMVFHKAWLECERGGRNIIKDRWFFNGHLGVIHGDFSGQWFDTRRSAMNHLGRRLMELKRVIDGVWE